MFTPLFRLGTSLSLRTLGARREIHRAGPVSLVVHRLGSATGEPWLLLHGLGATSLAWYPLLRALRSECDLWVPELSALGGTRSPGGSLNVREGTAVAIDLIERRIRRAPLTLAGVSLGGWMAARLTLERPDLVARLLLVGAAGYRNQDWLRLEDIVRVEHRRDVEPLLAALFHRRPWPIELSRPGFLAAYRSHAVRHVLATASPEDAYDDDDLARISAPTGLVWGDHDGLFPLEIAHAMKAALPAAELHVIADCGHLPLWENPAPVVEAVAAFRHHTSPPNP